MSFWCGNAVASLDPKSIKFQYASATKIKAVVTVARDGSLNSFMLSIAPGTYHVKLSTYDPVPVYLPSGAMRRPNVLFENSALVFTTSAPHSSFFNYPYAAVLASAGSLIDQKDCTQLRVYQYSYSPLLSSPVSLAAGQLVLLEVTKPGYEEQRPLYYYKPAAMSLDDFHRPENMSKVMLIANRDSWIWSAQIPMTVWAPDSVDPYTARYSLTSAQPLLPDNRFTPLIFFSSVDGICIAFGPANFQSDSERSSAVADYLRRLGDDHPVSVEHNGPNVAPGTSAPIPVTSVPIPPAKPALPVDAPDPYKAPVQPIVPNAPGTVLGNDTGPPKKIKCSDVNATKYPDPFDLSLARAACDDDSGSGGNSGKPGPSSFSKVQTQVLDFVDKNPVVALGIVAALAILAWRR